MLCTWDKITDKRITTLHLAIQAYAATFINRVDKELGIKLRVTEAYRSTEYQNALYAQGRKNVTEVNILRRLVGLPAITHAQNRIITNAIGGTSFHNYGLAIDVVEIRNGVAIWDNPRWKDIAKIGIELGFFWGGNFTRLVDKPHFEMSLGYTIEQLKKTKKDKTGLPILTLKA